MITVVAGGVGAARFLRGLVQVVPPAQVTAVVNTGDDVVLHGLHVSPDLDTVTYTLAGAIDPDRGWGLRDETWQAMGALARYAAVRPAGSTSAATWFNLGDQDLATHCYRTHRLAEGASLTEVTAEVARAWGVEVTLLPMSDHRIETRVLLAEPDPLDGRTEIGFQEYFVGRRHGVAIRGIRLAGLEQAAPGPQVLHALTHARAVVVAPSNPVVSIGPVLAVPGVLDALAARRATVAAVSPIVGGAALKGPADRMLAELGEEVSVVGVARRVAPYAGTLVVDEVDAALAGAVEAEGVRCVVTPSVMSTPAVAAALARTTLASVGVH